MKGMNGTKLVAIIGGSGAGKSWLADQLNRLLGEKAGRLSLDNFYRDHSRLPPSRRAGLNFDHPDAIEWPLFERALQNCAAGLPMVVPTYDFHVHCRLGVRGGCRPRPVMLVDGLWLLHRAALRQIFDLKIYVECPEKIRMQRRIARDTASRGRSPAASRRQFRVNVAPMHRRHVEPQMRWADVVIHQPCAEAEIQRLHEALWSLLQSNGSLQPAWMRETFRAEMTALLMNKEIHT